jgi:hypothetical protein
MAQPGLSGTIPLIPLVLELRWSMNFESFDVSVVNDQTGIVLWHTSLSPANSSVSWSGDQGLLREKIEISVNFGLGEFHVLASVGSRLPAMDWHDSTIEQRIYWNPALGSAGGKILAFPPMIDDPRFGKSRSVVANITRIVVDDKPRLGTDVGNKVKSIFFAAEPDFLFNVCFAVGDFTIGGSGFFADPSSPWFNVFMGYYEIDVPVSRGRPFGYKSEAATSRQIDVIDLTRIAKADWNYFSNYMYGVPEDAIRPYNRIPDQAPFTQGVEQIGGMEWDSVAVEGVDVVSAYAPMGQGLVNNSDAWSPVWRQTFGGPVIARVRGVEPFAGTKLSARMYLAFRKEDDRYRTRIFGGTVTDRHNIPEFLDAQMAACRATIERNFASLGFPRAIAAPTAPPQ